MKVCILGGGGWMGLNAAHHFRDMGHEVFCVGRSARMSAPFTDFYAHPSSIPHHVLHIHHELSDLVQLLDAERPAIIVNFAAQAERAASFDPDTYWRYYDTNVLGLARLTGYLETVDWLTRYVQVSSGEVYGNCTHAVTENEVLRPTAPYAASKAAADLHLLAIISKGFPAAIIRPGNAIGPGQQLYRVVPRALQAALTGRKIKLNGGGASKKSWTWVYDISKAIYTVATASIDFPIFNAACDSPLSVRDMVSLCAEECGTHLEDIADIAPARYGADACYWLDSSRLKALGWATYNWPLAEGYLRNCVRSVLAWFLKYPGLLQLEQTYEARP